VVDLTNITRVLRRMKSSMEASFHPNEGQQSEMIGPEKSNHHIQQQGELKEKQFNKLLRMNQNKVSFTFQILTELFSFFIDKSSSPDPNLSTPDLLYHHHHVSQHNTLPLKNFQPQINHVSAAATLNRYPKRKSGKK